MSYSSGGEPPTVGCRMERAGQLEEAALPLYGVSSIHATLDPRLGYSALHVNDIKVYDCRGDVRVSFELPEILRVTDKTRVTGKLRAVSDHKSGLFRGIRAYQIKTPVVLGRIMAVVPLWLLERALHPTYLVIGAHQFLSSYQVDDALAFELGRPQHSSLGLLAAKEF